MINPTSRLILVEPEELLHFFNVIYLPLSQKILALKKLELKLTG
jgi:hypothetical protein